MQRTERHSRNGHGTWSMVLIKYLLSLVEFILSPTATGRRPDIASPIGDGTPSLLWMLWPLMLNFFNFMPPFPVAHKYLSKYPCECLSKELSPSPSRGHLSQFCFLDVVAPNVKII